jgi:outer membrane protein OmpA-like peptidoglycan-associated protein
MLIKKMAAVAALGLLAAACSDNTQMVTAPPPPVPAPQPANFMVFFDWDRSNVSEQGQGTIRQAAQTHKNMGATPISVTGHADKSGPDGYNQALSMRRATAVKDGLVREGVASTAIAVDGKGESQPLVQTADGVREPQNRRVEIKMSGNMAAVTTGTVFTGTELDYCRHLSRLYRTNVSNSSPDSTAGAALAKCEAGNYAEGIPTLMRLLTDAGFQFPRHMRA